MMPIRLSSIITSAVLLIVLGITGGCAARDTGDQPSARPTTDTSSRSAGEAASYRPGISARDMIEQALNPGSDAPRHPFLDRIDPPRRLETEAVQNRHVPGQTDTIRTYLYDGLRLRVYDVSGDDDRLVTDIRIDSAGYDHGLAFDVGSPRSAVRAALGAPEETRGEDIRYRVEAGGEEQPAAAPHYLDVRIVNDRVERLVWRFYYD